MEPAGSEAFELQPSIWKLIDHYCPPEELEEVQRILGYAIVEQARDLHCEAGAHLEIWKQLKDESDERFTHRMPEPPAIRERLVQEIKFLLEHLEQREQYQRNETGTRKKWIEEYVRQRQGQHASLQSRPTSTTGYRSQSAMSVLSGTEGRCSALDGKARRICEHVTVMEVDSVIQNLREALQEECDIRKQEIQFLQGCVEDEMRRTNGKCEEPTIQELREFGTELEKEIMEGINPVTTNSPPVVYRHRGSRTTPTLPPLKQDVVRNAGVVAEDQRCSVGGCPKQFPGDDKGERNLLQNHSSVKPNPPRIVVGRTYTSLRADRHAFIIT